jgi:N-acetylneuraminic acid mutarotase
MGDKVAFFSQFLNGDSKYDKNETIPIARQGHASCLDNQYQMYVFSGRIPNNTGYGRKYIQDFWKLNINQKKWTKIEIDGPCERHSHSLCFYENVIYLFGGSNNNEYLPDLWAFNIELNKWSKIPNSRFSPSSRHGHSVAIYKNLMIIHGGKDGFGSNGKYLSDNFAFDFKIQQWIELKTKSNELIEKR